MSPLRNATFWAKGRRLTAVWCPIPGYLCDVLGEKVDCCTNLISMNTYRRDDRFGGIEGRLSRLIKENEDDLRRHEAESVLFHWPAGARPSVGDPRRAR